MQSVGYARRRVFGRIQRILHGALATSLVGLAVTGMIAQGGLDAGRERLMLIEAHASLGFAFAIFLALRLVWAVVGPRPARFSAFYLAARRLGRASAKGVPFSYEPQGGAAYLGLYGAMLVGAGSGLALAAIRYDTGPLAGALFDDFSLHAVYLLSHGITSWLIVAFIPAHIVGMIVHERRSGVPVAQAMVSGYKYEPREKRPS